MTAKYYAVRVGHQPGIYKTWAECQQQINGFSNAVFKSFASLAEAEAFMNPKTERVEPTNNYENQIQVYTDGGSRNHGNKKGGHVKTSDKAAWAYLIIMPDGNEYNDAEAELGATNNQMEITALIKALQFLIDHDLQTQSIKVISDSSYVLNAVTKHWITGWKRRGWQTSKGTPVKNKELWDQVDQLLTMFKTIDYEWTKGHADNSGNQFVDQKLNAAMDQMGHSGTIKVSKKAPHSDAPVADDRVKRAALENIDGVLNGKMSSNYHVHKSGSEHALSQSESVENIKQSLKQMNRFSDKNE